MSPPSMMVTDLLPKPYTFPKKRSRARGNFDLRAPISVRQYSGDRNARPHSSEYTLQQARKDMESKSRDRDVPKHGSDHCSKQKPDELRFEVFEDTFDRDLPRHGNNQSSKQKSDELGLEETLERDVPIHSTKNFSKQQPGEIAVNRFREWKPEDESFVFNIRPGRGMFPFLKDVSEAEDEYREYGDVENEYIQGQTTLRNEKVEDSRAPSHIVLTRNASSFVCESLDYDQIVEVI